MRERPHWMCEMSGDDPARVFYEVICKKHEPATVVHRSKDPCPLCMALHRLEIIMETFEQLSLQLEATFPPDGPMQTSANGR